MKCIILAAGYATRLYPITSNYPKPLLTIGNKTIIDWLIDDVIENTNINEYIIISNHKFKSIFDMWADKKRENLNHKGIKCRIDVIDDGSQCNENRLGAVKDIQYAIEKQCIKDDILVLAGDNILDFSIGKFVEYAMNKGTSCVMCYEEKDENKKRKTAIITMDKDGKITSFEEKPENPKGNYAVPPFYIYTKNDVERINEGIQSGCGIDAPGSYAAWLSSQTEMHAYNMQGKRYDIGDIESYEKVCKLFSL